MASRYSDDEKYYQNYHESQILISEVHSYSNSSVDTSSCPEKPETKSDSSVTVPIELEIKRPLVTVENRFYDDVVVNSVKLQTAEMRSLTSKNAAASLLNKVVDLIFTEEELVSTKGVKSLDQHKLSAIKEYMYARSVSMGIGQLQYKNFMSIIQNKICNLRFQRRRIMKLSTSSSNP